jgi:hypothetical protein
MTRDLPEPVRGELAIPGHFAQRTTELARRSQPAVRWQLRVLERPYVRVEGLVHAFIRDPSGRSWKEELLDASSGQADPAARHVMLWTTMEARRSRELCITGRREDVDTVVVGAVDSRSGQAVWRHAPVPSEEFRAGPWFWWLRSRYPDVDLLIPHGPDSRGTPRRLALIDPATGQVRWDIDWSDRVWASSGNRPPQAPGTRQVRLGPTYLDKGIPGASEAGLAGIDEADGTLLWHIEYPSANGWGWASPVYLGSSGRYLVLVGVPRLHDDKGWPAPGPGRRASPDNDEAPSPRVPVRCDTCGGLRPAYITVAVHDRLTGRQLWRVRWADRTAPHTPVAGVADICGDVVLTSEGDFLRARHIEDGRQLWATVPRPGYRLADQGSAPATQWAWLRQARTDPVPPDREPKDLFIHALTGQYLTIGRAFHQTQDDLVLTHAGGMLTCLELPR